MKKRGAVYIIVIVVVIVVLAILAFSIYQFTGGAIYKFCVDSDDGQDFLIKGTISNERGITYSDKCANNDILKEYYCKNDRIENIKHQCSGKCSEGVCVP